MCSTLKGVHTRLNNEPLPLNNQRHCNERQCKDMNRAHQLINGIAGNGKESQRGTHRREAKQGTMNRAHQLINEIAGNGKANQRGERLKHVQHPQRGTYKAEQRTALINSSTELQGTEKQGTMNRYHQTTNGTAMGGNGRQCKAL